MRGQTDQRGLGSEELKVKDKTRSRKQMKPKEKRSKRKEIITAEGKDQTDDSARERKANPTLSWKKKRSERERERREGLSSSDPPGKPKLRSG